MIPSEHLESAQRDRSFGNYYRLFARLTTEDREAAGAVRIALLGNQTLTPIARYLTVASHVEDLPAHTHEGNYGQHVTECLDEASSLYRFAPEIVVLALDHTALLPEPTEENVARGLNLIRTCADAISRHSTAIVLVHNLAVPGRTAHGNRESARRLGVRRTTARFNEALAAAFENDPRTFVVDLESLLSDFGKSSALDARWSHLARMPFAPDFIPVFAQEYLGYVKAIRGRSRKCIVVDADNTLWGGVVGEDGVDRIALGSTAPGSAFVAFQRVLLQFYHRGIVLALNTRNNPEDLFAVLDRHPDQILKRSHFAAVRVNWMSKADNLVEIARELNLGLDSMVFIDDDPANRAEVRQRLPEVLVLDLPGDASQYADALLRLNDFYAVTETEEDSRRGELYAAERLRTEARDKYASSRDYLRELELKVTIAPLDDAGMTRAVQLCQRTNQFNATTRRYNEAELRRMSSSPNYIMLTVSLRDRFGDSGMVGLCFVNVVESIARVDTLLMSCRALGRGVEDALLGTAMRLAAARGALRCQADIVFTRKNAPIRTFFQDRGFECVSSTEEGSSWETPLDRNMPAVPDYLAIIDVSRPELKLGPTATTTAAAAQAAD